MSSTNKTTNLELSQFIGSDSPKWLTDYNADMEKIDAGYQTVKAQADATDLIMSGHTSSISTLQDTTTSQGNSITQLRTDVNGNSGSINTINELLGSGEPTTSNKTVIGAINEINSDVADINTALGAAHKFSSIHRVSVTVDTNETLSDQLDRLITAVNNYLASLDAGTYVIPVAIGYGNGYEGSCKISLSMVLTHNSSLSSLFLDALNTIFTNDGIRTYECRIGTQKKLQSCDISSSAITVSNLLSNNPTVGSYVDFMVYPIIK